MGGLPLRLSFVLGLKSILSIFRRIPTSQIKKIKAPHSEFLEPIYTPLSFPAYPAQTDNENLIRSEFGEKGEVLFII